MAAPGTVRIALLRAVNLAGRKAVAMADLRSLVAELGFADVRSYIQSGNLVLRGDGRPAGAALERLLEREAAARLGVETAFFVRTAEEWSAMIAANPFPDEAQRDPGHLVAIVLKRAPAAAAVKALQGKISGREQVHAIARSLYAVYPDGIGRSRLTVKLIESTLGCQGTGRNWKTVLRLGEMV